MDEGNWIRLVTTVVLFGLTYLALALGRVPGLRLDRAGIALVGATALILTGILPFADAIRSINFETLVLLLGMMLVVGYLRLANFFDRLAQGVLSQVTTAHGLLAVTILLAGFLSAFLVNDVVCLALTPLLIRVTRRLGLDPVPHLIALATAANIGSAATITGNPQNMIIGTQSAIPYLRFTLRLAPPALFGLVLDYAVLALVFRKALAATKTIQESTEVRIRRSRAHDRLLLKGSLVALTVVGLFFVGFPVHLVALGGASAMLLGRVRPAKVFAEVDWGLLVMFSGLFAVIAAFNTQIVQLWGIEEWTWLQQDPIGLLSLVSAGLSNLVSNVPAVLLFEPILTAMPGESRETAWLALAMSSTFAGNLTVLGSVANLIVVENAQREGIEVTFGDYCRVGIPVTVLTLLVGVLWLRWGW